MTTTTIRVSEPRELLAYLPYRLGFRPRESAVVVSLRGSRGRLGLVARVDLADVVHPEEGASTTAGLAAHLWRDGAEQAAVVLYADAARPRGRWRPDVVDAARALVTTLEERVGPTAVWVVDEERYYCFDCDDPSCCPRWGWPLRELESSQVSAQMVFAGARIAEHRGEIAAVTPVRAAARYNVRRVAGRWKLRRGESVDADGGGEAGPALAAWRTASLDAWATAVAAARAGVPVRARTLGRIDAALRDVVVRDAVIMACATSVEEACAAVAAPAEDAARRIGAAFDLLFDAESGLEPERDGLDVSVHVLREIVAHAPDGAHAPALTVLALLAWWSGDGATANCWLDEALAVGPGYRLARLLESTLTGGVPPGWVRRSAAQDARLR